MDDPVFDFYKKFYKKASSWFMTIIAVLIVIIIVGVAYVAIAKLKEKNDNKNDNIQTTEGQAIDNKTDTQMNEQDLFDEPAINNSNLNQNSENGGVLVNPYDQGTTSLPQDELGL